MSRRTCYALTVWAWVAVLAPAAALAAPGLAPNERRIEGDISQIDTKRRQSSQISVTRRSPRGNQVLVLGIESSTKVTRDGKADDVSNLKVGDRVEVTYRLGTPLVATAIAIKPKPASDKPSKPELSAITGQLTQMGPKEIMVTPARAGAPIKLVVGAGTTVIRNGESARPEWLLAGDRVTVEYLPGTPNVAKLVQARGKVVPRPKLPPTTGKQPQQPQQPQQPAEPQQPAAPPQPASPEPADQPDQEPANEPVESGE